MNVQLSAYSLATAPQSTPVTAPAAQAAPEQPSSSYSWTEYFILTGVVIAVAGVAAAFFGQIQIYYGVAFGLIAISSGYALYQLRKYSAISKMDASYEKAQKTISQLESTVKQMGNENVELSKDQAKFKEENKKLKDAVSKTEKATASLNDSVKNYEKQNAALSKVNDEYARNLGEVQKQNASMASLLKGLDASVADMGSVDNQLGAKLQTFQKCVEQIDRESQDLGKNMRVANVDLVKNLRRFSSTILQSHASSEKVIADLRDQQQTMQGKIEQLKKAEATMQLLVAKMTQKEVELSAREKEVQQSQKRLSLSVSQMGGENQGLSASINQIHQERVELEKVEDQLKASVTNLRKEKETIDKTLTLLAAKARGLKKDIEELKDHKEKLVQYACSVIRFQKRKSQVERHLSKKNAPKTAQEIQQDATRLLQRIEASGKSTQAEQIQEGITKFLEGVSNILEILKQKISQRAPIEAVDKEVEQLLALLQGITNKIQIDPPRKDEEKKEAPK